MKCIRTFKAAGSRTVSQTAGIEYNDRGFAKKSDMMVVVKGKCFAWSLASEKNMTSCVNLRVKRCPAGQLDANDGSYAVTP